MVPLSLEMLQIILPYSLILAAMSLIESLLTLNVVADMTETRSGALQSASLRALQIPLPGSSAAWAVVP